MTIDYRHACDGCGKSLVDDGIPIYCEECYNELVDRLEEAQRRIEELEEELERR